MKRGDYNQFKERVAEATEHDVIWFEAEMWDSLTDKQADDMIRLLRVHPSVVREGSYCKLPTGVKIKIIE